MSKFITKSALALMLVVLIPHLVNGSDKRGPFEIGDFVQLHGLQNSSSFHLNKQVGTVVVWSEPFKQWCVSLDKDKDCFSASAKPANMMHVVPAQGPFQIGDFIRLHSLISAPHLNGETGTVQAWNTTEERYRVILKNGKHTGILVKSANMTHISMPQGRFQIGDSVRLQDLKNASDLNGETGTVRAWNPTAEGGGRYRVILQNGHPISVKPTNLNTCGRRRCSDSPNLTRLLKVIHRAYNM